MPVTTNTRKLAALLGASGAGIGTDGLMQPAGIDADMATQTELDAIPVYDDNPIQANLAILAIRQAADHNDVKYSLQDRIIDTYYDASGIDGTPSNNHTLAAGSYGSSTSSTSNTYDVNGSDAKSGSLQTLTLAASTTEITIEAWGGRGGASNESWKKNTSSTIDNTSGAAGSEEGGGFTVRLKGTYSGLEGGETIKIAVGKFGEGATGGYGCHSGGGGASWVLLEHASAIGQTRGVNNSKIWTPLLVAGGGGGAAARSGLGYNQDQSSHTRHAEADANLATSNGITRLGTVVSPFNSSNTGKYTTGTDDGEGGTSTALGSTPYTGAGGAGFLADGSRPLNSHDGFGDDSEGKHPFHASTPFEGGQDAGPSASYGRARGGYGGGGGGHIGGSGGAGGFSGGSGSGAWSEDGTNGIGGGSLFGSTISIGGSYENAISVTENTNTLADDADASPASGKMEGRVIIIQSAAYLDLTLQSTDTEAETQPTKADMIMLVEDAGSGVGTVQTHIKGWVSRDSGTTFTQGTLVDEGDWGTDKRILAFHDLDISGQPADKTMCYKITTHSASAVYNTKIHATSIGWK